MEQVKKRYKMYKSGKVWLFAGITLVTLNMNVVTGRADESTHVEALTEPAVATLSEGNAEQQSPVTDAMDESAMSELVTEAQPIKVQAAEEQYTDEIVNQSDDEHANSDQVSVPVTDQVDSETPVPSDEHTATLDTHPNQSTTDDSEQPVSADEQSQDIDTDSTAKVLSSQHKTETINERGSGDLAGVIRNPERPHLTDGYRNDDMEDDDSMAGIWGAGYNADGIKWHFDADSGVLVLDGGDIYDCYGDSPWQSKSWVLQIVKVVISKPIRIIGDSGGFFENLTNVEHYEGLEKIDVSSATDLRYFFSENTHVKELDLSSWQVGNVTDMSCLFFNSPGTSQLTTINISGWDTRRVSEADYMFGPNEKLTRIIGIENLNFESLKEAGGLFIKTGLSELDLSKWKTDSLDNMAAWFMDMHNLTSVKFGSQFKTDQVTWIHLLFSGCSNLTEVDLSGFNLHRVEQNLDMFAGCERLQKITLGPDTDLTPAKIESVGLMDIEANEQYTGYWINVANPQQRLTSAELMNLYSGKNTPIGTYIWEANQAVIDANDITLEVGDDWNWTDSIESLTDQFGQKVDVQALYVANPQAVKLSGDRVNTSQPGTYQVTFKYAGKTVTALVIVKADQTSLTVHDTELHAGGTWHAQDGFDGATDKDGHAIDFNDVTITGEVNTMVPGDYQITYTYGSQTQTITVTVKENQASLNLYQNHATVHTDGQGTSTWQPQSNFQNATDSDGQTLDWSAIEVVGTPDWTTAGDYRLRYQFTDKTGQLVTATMTVTVVIEEADEQAESQSDLQIHDSTITVGESWQPSDNLVLATDVNGGELSLADLVVTGTVDTNQAGVYQVTYQYTDASGQVFTRVATVTVVAASDGDTNTEQPGATNTNDDVNGGSTGSIDGDDQAEIPTDDADQMEGDAADVDANAVIDDATPAVGTNHGKGADRNSGMQTTANGAKSVVTSWPHRSQTSNTVSSQHAQTIVAGHHQESRPTESASVAVQPATAKLGTSALPQTGEAPSRANVMGTVLLGLTMFGSWLGFRRVKRH